ncbi:hypothetical protein NL676_037628 [Syzygium grande]|nr:hypothetical protein NL676_037628 [Syzygium grande]
MDRGRRWPEICGRKISTPQQKVADPTVVGGARSSSKRSLAATCGDGDGLEGVGKRTIADRRDGLWEISVKIGIVNSKGGGGGGHARLKSWDNVRARTPRDANHSKRPTIFCQLRTAHAFHSPHPHEWSSDQHHRLSYNLCPPTLKVLCMTF